MPGLPPQYGCDAYAPQDAQEIRAEDEILRQIAAVTT
jgi:hypothetical protein